MRVLVVAASPPWPMTDGASLVLNHQLRQLARRHEITVLAAGRPPDGRIPDLASVGLGDDATIRWYGPTGSRLGSYIRSRGMSIAKDEPAAVFAVELPDLLHDLDACAPMADVVHLHGWGTARLTRRVRAPTVHMAIDAWQRGHGEQRSLPAWRRLVEADQRSRIVRHERRHYPECDIVVVVAPTDAEVLRSAVPNARVDVIPNGVEPGPVPPGPATDPVLGFHGVLSTVANEAAALSLVDRVLPLVRATHPDARALVIGKDPGPALLSRRGPSVEITGAVPDVREQLTKVAVYVAAFDRGSGIKNKVLEAMAAGLPVVATPRAVDGIACQDGVLVGEEPEDLARAVEGLLSDEADRERRGTAGRVCAEQRTWAAGAAALEALWDEAVTVGGR